MAIAGSGRALHDVRLKVAEREVDDLSGSVTRFLIVGDPASFGEFVGGSDPTLRSILVGSGTPPGSGSGPSYDEVLLDGSGGFLCVSSGSLEEVPGSRYLGRVPWSPRTPVVRVSAE